MQLTRKPTWSDWIFGSSVDKIHETADVAQDTPKSVQCAARAAEEAAAQTRQTLNNPGGGISGQPTIPRDRYTQDVRCRDGRYVPTVGLSSKM
ncbi:hypothetical protein RUND412_010049 [Rhizina undulata]